MVMEEGVLVFVSRCLSYSVIFLSVFVKVPQVLALYRAGSSRGVSARSYWIEIVCYKIGIAYGFYYGHHISIYGDGVLLALQSYVIVALAVNYSRDWTLENGAWLVVNGVFMAAIVTKSIPPTVLSLLMASTVPLIIASRGTQIYEIYSIKSPGDVSITTFALSTYGCAARLVTVAVELNDLQILLTFVLSLMLNSIVVIQCIVYSSNNKNTSSTTSTSTSTSSSTSSTSTSTSSQLKKTN